LLSAIAGVVLSLCASYLPGFAPWFQALEATKKRLIMAGALLAASVAIVGLSCGGIIHGVSCNQSGIVSLAWAFILALVTNQSTFSISKPSNPKLPVRPEVQ
jgi:hypothetical protein